MLHSLELMPDEAGTALVRADWQVLHDAGLPSQLDHRGATNAPHVTAIAVPSIDESDRQRAVELIGTLLPVRCHLTGLVVLGGRRAVIARLLEVPDPLVEAVLRLRAGTEGHPFEGWLPHVTLAHGLGDAALARAAELLDRTPSPFVLASLRHWDPTSRVVTTLAAPPPA